MFIEGTDLVKICRNYDPMKTFHCSEIYGIWVRPPVHKRIKGVLRVKMEQEQVPVRLGREQQWRDRDFRKT